MPVRSTRIRTVLMVNSYSRTNMYAGVSPVVPLFPLWPTPMRRARALPVLMPRLSRPQYGRCAAVFFLAADDVTDARASGVPTNGVRIPRRGRSGLLYCAKPPPVIPDSRQVGTAGGFALYATDAQQPRNKYRTTFFSQRNSFLRP